jgi:signal transduction histidine kinase
VINSVLDLSKSAAGQLRLCPEDVDLSEILRDCAKLTAKQCADAGLTLRMSGADRTLPVRGEKAKLRQIFLNLLSNAIKFTEREGAISIDVTEQFGVISVAVSDTGIGMSAQDIQVALTLFGQVDNRLERKYEGTGLGLPLTKSFVELHGGELQIDSSEGCGTTVTVRFGTARDAVSPMTIRASNHG